MSYLYTYHPNGIFYCQGAGFLGVLFCSVGMLECTFRTWCNQPELSTWDSRPANRETHLSPAIYACIQVYDIDRWDIASPCEHIWCQHLVEGTYYSVTGEIGRASCRERV